VKQTTYQNNPYTVMCEQAYNMLDCMRTPAHVMSELEINEIKFAIIAYGWASKVDSHSVSLVILYLNIIAIEENQPVMGVDGKVLKAMIDDSPTWHKKEIEFYVDGNSPVIIGFAAVLNSGNER